MGSLCEGEMNTMYTNNATMIQRNDSGLFTSILDDDQQPEHSSRNLYDKEQKLRSHDNLLNDTIKPNKNDVTTTSKLMLRSRTHSTEILSVVSSQDTLYEYGRKLDTEPNLTGSKRMRTHPPTPEHEKGSSSSGTTAVDSSSKKSYFGRHNNKIQEKASLCVSFNIFSIFD